LDLPLHLLPTLLKQALGGADDMLGLIVFSQHVALFLVSVALVKVKETVKPHYLDRLFLCSDSSESKTVRCESVTAPFIYLWMT
jgi:hypothetical protein